MRSLIACAILLGVFASCSKEKMAERRIEDKWYLYTVETNAESENSFFTDTTEVYEDGTYYEFDEDGVVTFYDAETDETDTSTYELIGAEQLILDGDTAQIEEIKSRSMILFQEFEDFSDPGNMVRVTLNFETKEP